MYWAYVKEIKCKCGTKYSLQSRKVSMRDKDSIECEECGATLNNWNEAKMYQVNRIQEK